MMKLGSENVAGLYLGGQKITRAYLGSGMVFDSVPAPAVCTVTVLIDPSGGGTAAGAGQYREGESVTVQAAAADGYAFSGWQENGQTVSEDTEYTFAVSGDRALTAAFALKPSKLPAGYVELQYIISSETDTYINSGVSSPAIGKVQMKVSHISGGNSASTRFYFGNEIIHYNASNGRRTTDFGMFANKSYAVIAMCATKTSTNSTVPTNTGTVVKSGAVSSAAEYELELDVINKTASCNHDVVSIPVATHSSNDPIYILARGYKSYPGLSNPNIDPGFEYGIYCRFYFCRIWGSDGVLVRDFVPCTDPSGKVGAYDMVSKTFFDSYGSGKFTAGPAV